MRLLALLLVGACAPACGTPETAFAKGTVQSSDGEPLEGAWVVATLSWYGCCDGGGCGGERQACGKTDDEGSFELRATERNCWPGADLSGIFLRGFKTFPDYEPSGENPIEPTLEGSFTIYRCGEPGGAGPCTGEVKDKDYDWCTKPTKFKER